MNNKNAEWQREYYLTHDKYRMQGQGTDCYKVVKSLTRILQLPTIAKLTTDNESVIDDFRLNSGEYGLEPYVEYAIKVDDTYGASFYILVHALKEHGVHDVVIYTDARVAQYMSENASRLLNGRSEVCRRYIDMAWNTMTSVSVRFVTSPVKSEYAQLTASTVNCFIKPRV